MNPKTNSNSLIGCTPRGCALSQYDLKALQKAVNFALAGQNDGRVIDPRFLLDTILFHLQDDEPERCADDSRIILYLNQHHRELASSRPWVCWRNNVEIWLPEWVKLDWLDDAIEASGIDYENIMEFRGGRTPLERQRVEAYTRMPTSLETALDDC